MITRTQWRHWAVTLVAYVPNAVAADVLLSRLGRLQDYPVRYFSICLVADLAIWFLCSRAFGRFPR